MGQTRKIWAKRRLFQNTQPTIESPSHLLAKLYQEPLYSRSTLRRIFIESSSPPWNYFLSVVVESEGLTLFLP